VTSVRTSLVAAAAILRRDATVYFSYRWRLISQSVGVVFTLGVFYYISRLVRVSTLGSHTNYFAYVAIGIVILQVLQATLDTPTTVRQELVAGTFERMVVSPFGAVACLLSLFLFPLLYSLIAMLVTLGIAAAVFGLDVHWATVPLALPVALVGSIAFASIGMFFAAMIVRFKQAPGTAYVLAATSLVAGFYFPPSLLPWWLRWASEVQPFTPAVDLLRHLLVGQPLRYGAGEDLGKLIGFSSVLVPLGVLALAWAVDASRRTGTITEY
jgi:ABC-type polysaccharide/polyol phosphate export permease